MSHVVSIDVVIHDLDSLEQACKNLGLQLNRGQKKYRWYGHHVGDYPLPKGFTKEDLGKCDHAISIPGNKAAYEIGVVKKKDGEGYTLVWDFWNSGYGMEAKVGKDCIKLQHEYSKEVVVDQMKSMGYTVGDIEYNDQGEATITAYDYTTV